MDSIFLLLFVMVSFFLSIFQYPELDEKFHSIIYFRHLCISFFLLLHLQLIGIQDEVKFCGENINIQYTIASMSELIKDEKTRNILSWLLKFVNF